MNDVIGVSPVLSAGRGGMCRNPFGGGNRLDKCNLQGPSQIGDEIADVASDTPGERTLLVEVLRDAAFQYLFWGLGRKRAEIVDQNWAQITGRNQVDARIRAALVHPREPEEMDWLLGVLAHPAELAVAA